MWSPVSLSDPWPAVSSSLPYLRTRRGGVKKKWGDPGAVTDHSSSSATLRALASARETSLSSSVVRMTRICSAEIEPCSDWSWRFRKTSRSTLAALSVAAALAATSCALATSARLAA